VHPPPPPIPPIFVVFWLGLAGEGLETGIPEHCVTEYRTNTICVIIIAADVVVVNGSFFSSPGHAPGAWVRQDVFLPRGDWFLARGPFLFPRIDTILDTDIYTSTLFLISPLHNMRGDVPTTIQ